MSTDTNHHGSDRPRVEVYPDKEAVVEFGPSLTFECVEEYTWCCHRGVVLHDADLIALAARENVATATTQHDGQSFVSREPQDREESVGVDGEACFFLREDSLCALQADHDWKPARCSMFSLQVTVTGDDLHVGVRDDAGRYCDGLGVSERREIDHLDAFLPALLRELDDPDSHREPKTEAAGS